MAKLKAPDPMAKLLERSRLERSRGHYDLYINGTEVMCLEEYSKIVSKSKPRTHDQMLIGEVLALLDTAVSERRSPRPRFLSRKVYDDLKATFKRSRKAGKAEALELAKKLYLDDFNHAIQASTWVKNSCSSGVLELKLLGEEVFHPYWVRFNDGVDSITVKCGHAYLSEYFSIFWYFKAWKIKELISLMNKSQHLKFTSSIQDVEKETLLKALELALRYNTTLGAALFLTARE